MRTVEGSGEGGSCVGVVRPRTPVVRSMSPVEVLPDLWLPPGFADPEAPAGPLDLDDGDVVVFGASARLHYHGVRPVKDASHPSFGAVRWNLTFRRALGPDGPARG